MKLTLKTLVEKRACKDQVALFQKIFGEEVNVTSSLARKHYKDFDWDWADQHLLNYLALVEYRKVRGPAFAEYEKVQGPAFAEYEKVRDTAFAEYEKVRDTALVEYRKVQGPALAEYKKVRDTAWDEYEKVRDTAFAGYKKVRAAAFAKAYNSQEEPHGAGRSKDH